MAASALFAGFDFGTESVRVVLVDQRGQTAGAASANYAHGQIICGSESEKKFFGRAGMGAQGGLPPSFALQHPQDWLDASASAAHEALRSGAIDPRRIKGIGVDFTSCTLLPCRADGVPLCLDSIDGGLSSCAGDPHAWAKLWKHHGAITQAARMNTVAQQRGERWLERYGGAIGLESLFPKILEVIECAPRIAAAADVWLEAGDWFVWQLTGSLAMGGDITAEALPRSTCQAGYKALWSAESGYPSQEYFAAVHPQLAETVRRRLPGRFIAPGRRAGSLCGAMANRLGLNEGTAVSAAIIDAHAGVPGAGVGRPGILVMVMGTSGCHMLLGPSQPRSITGIAGAVRDGILPGYCGYETGQAAMGDGFDLVRRLAGDTDFARLGSQAAAIPPGADGLLCIDWFNGCRSPLMDASLSGAVIGLRLNHSPAHIYRAALEASAFGLRWIVDMLRDGGLAVDGFVATGGLPRKNALFMQIVASVLQQPVMIHLAEHGSALGAAIIGALAAGSNNGGFDDIEQAVDSMAGAASALPPPARIDPQPQWAAIYQRQYQIYREFCAELARSQSPLRQLHEEALAGP